jgi:hypothetical protein
MGKSIQDCGPPPAIPNGVALLSNPNGTLSGDTATIMCNDWYQSKVTTISCSDLGVWQTATCAGMHNINFSCILLSLFFKMQMNCTGYR